MIIFTHWMFANHFIKDNHIWREGDFSLNRMGFRLGNILPDISAMSRTNHYMDDVKPLIVLYESKVKDLTLSSRDRSIALGVLCHFYADFFCKYHNDTHFQKKSILNHCAYEIRLHLILLKLKGQGLLSKKRPCLIEKHLIETSQRLELKSDVRLDTNENVGLYFYHLMIDVYTKERDGLVKDILFAMLASRQLLLQYLYRAPLSNQKAGYSSSEYPAF